MAISFLNEQCDVIQKTSILNGVGRPTVSESTLYSRLRCKRDPFRFRSQEMAQPGGNQQSRREMIFTEFKSDITAEMEILLDGITFEIISVDPARTGVSSPSHLEIEVRVAQNS